MHRGTDASALRKKGIPTAWNDHLRIWKSAAASAASRLPEPVRKDARDVISRIRQIERQRASDASADRHRTRIALRAVSRFMAAEETVPDHPEAARQAAPCAFREHPRHPVSAPEFPTTAPP